MRIVLGVLGLGAIAVLAAHTPGVQALVLQQLTAELRRSQRIDLQAAKLRYNLLTLSATLDEVRLAAVESTDRPFASATRVDLIFGPRTLRGDVEVRGIVIESASVTIQRNGDGSGNLPTLAASTSSGNALMWPSVLAHEVDVSVSFDDVRTEVDDAAIDLRATMPPGRVSGTIQALHGLRVIRGNRTIELSSASVAVDLDGTTLALRDSIVRRPGSDLAARGTVDFGGKAPAIDVQFDGTIDLATWQTADVSSVVGGVVTIRGRATGEPSRPIVSIEAAAPELTRADLRVHSTHASATYRDGTLELERVSARLGGGVVDGSAAIALHGQAPSRAELRWSGVDVGSITEATPYTEMVARDGTANLEWIHAASTLRASVGASTGLVVNGELRPVFVTAVGTGDRWHVKAAPREPGDWTFDIDGHLRLDDDWRRSPVNARVRFSARDPAPIARQAQALGVVPETLDIAQVRGAIELDTMVTGTISRAIAGGRATARDFMVAGLPPIDADSSFNVDVATRRSSGTFSAVASDLGQVPLLSDRLTQMHGAIEVTGTWDGPLDSPYLTADITAEDVDAVAGAAMIGRARLEATVEGSSADLRGKGQFAVETVHVSDRALGAVIGEVVLTAGSVRVKGRAPDVNLTADGTMELRAPYPFSGRAEITPTSLSQLAALTGIAVDDGEVRGDVAGVVDFNGTIDDIGALSATLVSRPLDAVVYGVPVVIEDGVRATWRDRGMAVTAATARIGEVMVRVSGGWSARDPAGQFTADLEGELDSLSPWLSRLDATTTWSAGGHISAHLESQPSTDGVLLSGTVRTQQGRVERGGETLVENLQLAITLTGRRAQITEFTGTVPGGEVELTGHTPLSWANEWLPAPWRLASDSLEGALAASASLDVEAIVARTGRTLAQPLTGGIVIATDLTATAPRLAAILGTIRFDRVNLTAANTTLEQAVPTRLRVENGRVEIEALNWKAPSSSIVARGGLSFADGVESDLHASFTVDLGAIRAVLPGRAGGTITGDASLLGSPGAWRPTADVTLQNATLLMSQQGLFLDGLTGRVAIGEAGVTLSNIAGRINGGTLRIDGHLAPGAGRDDRLTDGVMIDASHVILNIPRGLHSELNARLRWRPVGDLATIDGAVTITTGRYTEPITQILRLVESLTATTNSAGSKTLPPWMTRSTIDVTIALTDPLVIENSVGLVELMPDLRVVGTLASPALSGRITIADEGRLRFGGRSFRLRESHLQFAPATGLQPTLFVTGETRVGEYDVTMRVTGIPGQIETAYDSSPPLSERDLRSLLVTGSTDSAGQGDSASDFAASAAASDVLGFAGQFVGLDSVRVGAADLDLAAREENTDQHLTISKTFGRRFELIVSDNLETGSFTWMVVWRPSTKYEFRLASIEETTEMIEFRQTLSFGPGAADSPVQRRRRTPRGAEIGDVTFSGDPGFSAAELGAILELRSGDRFEVQAWIEDRLRLRRFYEERGFYRVRVVPTRTAATDTAGREMWLLAYAIDRGPRTVVESTGDDLPSAVVDDLYGAWRALPIADLVVPEFEQIIRAGLAERGYDRADIRVEIAADTPAVTQVRVHTIRGPQTRRTIVEWHGNTAVGDAELEPIVAANRVGSVAIDFEGAAWEVEQLYAGRGYLSATVSFARPTFEGDVATIAATVAEGPRSVVSKIVLDGVASERLTGVRSALGISEGDALTPALSTEALKRLRARYADLGYHSAQITPTLENTGDDTAALTLKVVEGPRSVVQAVRVDGAESTDRALIADAITLGPGSVAAQSAAVTTRRNLYDIGSFRRVEVSFEPLASDEPGDTRLVNFTIEAEEPRRFQLRYGVLFATDTGERGGEGSAGPGVSVELRDRNFLGRAIQASAGGHYEKNLQALTGLFSFPRAFDRAIRTKIYGRDRRERLFGDEVTLVKTERDVSIEQRWRPMQPVELAWGYQFEYRLYRLNQDEQLSDFGGFLAGPIASLVIDRRDSPFDAKRGWFHSSSLKIGVEPLGSDLGYVRYLTRQSVYQQLGPLTLAGNARWGTMIGYSGSAPLSTLDLFFLAGGTNTVRGYRENSLSAVNVADIYLGGTSLLVLNGELRFPIFRMVRGAAFVDSGNTFTATREIALDRMAVGSGLGLRIATPLAPLRLDFGYPVTEGFGPSGLRIHFSIGQMF